MFRKAFLPLQALKSYLQPPVVPGESQSVNQVLEGGWHQPDRSQSTQVPTEGLASAVGHCMSLTKTKIKVRAFNYFR